MVIWSRTKIYTENNLKYFENIYRGYYTMAIYRRYYTVARRYEFYVRVAGTISHERANVKCSFY